MLDKLNNNLHGDIRNVDCILNTTV